VPEKNSLVKNVDMQMELILMLQRTLEICGWKPQIKLEKPAIPKGQVLVKVPYVSHAGKSQHGI